MPDKPHPVTDIPDIEGRNRGDDYAVVLRANMHIRSAFTEMNKLPHNDHAALLAQAQEHVAEASKALTEWAHRTGLSPEGETM
jgi:hypothetical protein